MQKPPLTHKHAGLAGSPEKWIEPPVPQATPHTQITGTLWNTDLGTGWHALSGSL